MGGVLAASTGVGVRCAAAARTRASRRAPEELAKRISTSLSIPLGRVSVSVLGPFPRPRIDKQPQAQHFASRRSDPNRLWFEPLVIAQGPSHTPPASGHLLRIPGVYF